LVSSGSGSARHALALNTLLLVPSAIMCLRMIRFRLTRSSPQPTALFPVAGRFTQNRFTQNRFTQNRFTQNRFTQNRFTQNRFTQNRPSAPILFGLEPHLLVQCTAKSAVRGMVHFTNIPLCHYSHGESVHGLIA